MQDNSGATKLEKTLVPRNQGGGRSVLNRGAWCAIVETIMELNGLEFKTYLMQSILLSYIKASKSLELL